MFRLLIAAFAMVALGAAANAQVSEFRVGVVAHDLNEVTIAISISRSHTFFAFTFSAKSITVFLFNFISIVAIVRPLHRRMLRRREISVHIRISPPVTAAAHAFS